MRQCSARTRQRFPWSPVPLESKAGPGDTMVMGIALSIAKRMVF